MKSKWITHKGVNIFYIDLSDFSHDTDAFKEELRAAQEVTLSQPLKSVLVITDVRNTALSSENVRFAQESSSLTTPHVAKTAVIGVAGVGKILLDAVSLFSGQKFATFEDIEAAKDWLVD